MAFDPFASANRILSSAIQNRMSPETARIGFNIEAGQQRLQQEQEIFEREKQNSNLLRNYLAQADLTSTKPSDFLRDIAAITGETNLVAPIAGQLVRENAFEQSVKQLQELQKRTQELTSQFTSPESEGGSRITPTEEFQLSQSQAVSGEAGIEAAKITKGQGIQSDSDIVTGSFSKEAGRLAAQQAFAGEEDPLTGKAAGVKFDRSVKLRNEFVKLSDEFIKQRDSFSRIKASSEDPSAAGDLALIFNYMKLLDPNSVVRESEFQVAESARAWLSSMDNAGEGARVPSFVRSGIQKLDSGQRLLPKQRKDFVDRAGRLFKRSERQQGSRIKEYTRLAKRAGVSPEDVIVDLGIVIDQEQDPTVNQNTSQPQGPPSVDEGQREVVSPPKSARDFLLSDPELSKYIKQ